MRNISSWAIKNPIIPVVLFLVLTVMGVGSFFKLPINSNPEISFPAFIVSVGMPGAAPRELENQVAVKIEGALASIEGVKSSNTTLRTGSSDTFVELQIGTDIAKAVDDARAAVANVRSELPADIYEPQVSRLDFNDQEPLAIYSIQSSKLTPEEVSWLIDREVNRELLTVKGVGRVERLGGVERQITVDIDPARLAAFGVTASDVSRALRSQNVDLPAGKAESGAGEQPIRALGSAKTVEELSNMPISLPTGRVLRLADVADVRDGATEMRGVSRFNGTPVSMFQVLRTKTASSLKAYKLVQTAIKKIDDANPDIVIEPVYTPVDYVQESYDMSMATLFEGALLATLVVAVFLGGWRPVFAVAAITGVVLFGAAWAINTFTKMHISTVAVLAIGTLVLGIATFIMKAGRPTFLAAIAIPLSTIPTFAVMDLMGFTLNEITLLALALVAGILVDDAIVEIENIIRHIRMGKSPYAAALEAADEIGLAVVATTATIVAVFLPVSMMTGVIGQFFKSFGLTVAVAVLFSLLVARLITPLIAAFILTRSPPEEEPEGAAKGYYEFLDKMLTVRTKPIWWLKDGLLWGRWATMGAGILVFVGTIIGVIGLSTPFFKIDPIQAALVPDIDQGFVQMSVDLPPGLSPSEADQRAREVAEVALNRPETKTIVQNVRGDLTGAIFFISMKDRKERKLTQSEYKDELRKEIAKIPGVRAGFGGGWGSNSVEINLTSDDPSKLDAASARMVNEMRKFDWAVDIKSTADLTRPEIHIRPRAEEAARLGVSLAEIATAARIGTSGDIDLNLAKFNAGERQIPILVRLSRDNRGDIEALRSLRVMTSSGQLIPLETVAEISFGGGEARVVRQNRERIVTVSANLDGIEAGAAYTQIKEASWYKNPGEGVLVRQSEGDAELGDVGTQFIIALLTGIMLIYVVLVLLFKDFIMPITLVSVFFLSPVGAVLALRITGTPFSIPVAIGLLMLFGIAVKNSILLVDFIIESQHAGVPRHTAIMDAARKRSRPIIMTTIAMIAGMVPAAMSTSGPGAFRHGMAVAVIGGLALSTVLSLVFVPAVYTIMDDLDQWVKGLFKAVPTVTNEDRAIAVKEDVERRASRAAAE
jgi:hydrophobic/amphiphilic exporter-1 (mainly G- bacteria), HAE1 family